MEGGKMDDTLGKQVFAQMIEDGEITDLNIPPMKMPKTFKTLLTIAYLSDLDSPTTSGRSSSSSSRSSTDGSNDSDTGSPPPKEWAHIFAKDGSLRFDNILPALPPIESDFSLYPLTYMYGDAFESAVLALAHYNANNEGAEYELVAPVLSNFMHHVQHFFIIHVNFIAKRSNCDSPPELFYAEVIPSGFDVFPDQDQIVRCTILQPRLRASSPGDVVVDSNFRPIYHPPDVDCWPCNTVPLSHVDSNAGSSDDEAY